VQAGYGDVKQDFTDSAKDAEQRDAEHLKSKP
jgi:hypothetical protein